MQAAENRSALRTPFQEATGLGARHRRSPTGGAANGIPRYTITDESAGRNAFDESVARANGFCGDELAEENETGNGDSEHEIRT